jgi:hypothetical protein
MVQSSLSEKVAQTFGSTMILTAVLAVASTTHWLLPLNRVFPSTMKAWANGPYLGQAAHRTHAFVHWTGELCLGPTGQT